MRFYINKKIFSGFIIAMIIICSLGIGSYLYIGEVIRSSKTSFQSEQISLEAERVHAALSKIENNIMNYHRNGDQKHLLAVKSTATFLRQCLQNLSAMVSSNPQQLQRVRQLTALAEEKIKPYETDSLVSEQKITGLTSEVDDAAVTRLILDIQDEQSKIKRDLQETVTDQFFRFAFVFFGLLIIGLVLLCVLAYALNANHRQRAEAEEKLNLALQAVRDLYEHAPCGYFSINSDGVFSNINETLLEWLGYKRAEVVDRLYITNVLRGEPIFDEDFSRFKEYEFLSDLEAEMVRKDKSGIPVILNASTLKDGQGKTTGLRCSLVDNTAHKKAEEKSTLLNKELEAFSYSVSHDLRSPLRSINGYTQILFEDYGNKVDEEGQRLIKVIMRSANRMGQLIDDLLDFSRMGRKELTKTKTNMTELVGHIVEELMQHERGRDIRLNTMALNTADVDASMIRQVWTNLISNALKYSRKKDIAYIDIGFTEDEHQITYFVKDNGAGFNMDYAHKLFGVFQRLHKEVDFEGTGVGLALVKRIIDRHHGQIWAESKVDEGSSFYFSIPKA